jgi:hypothetical protein
MLLFGLAMGGFSVGTMTRGPYSYFGLVRSDSTPEQVVFYREAADRDYKLFKEKEDRDFNVPAPITGVLLLVGLGLSVVGSGLMVLSE